MVMPILTRVLLAAALAWSSAATAMTYVMPTDSELIAQSDGVLVGTVTGAPVASKRGGRLPHVEYRVVVERVLAGRFPHAEALLAMPGSAPGAAVIAHIPGVPALADGQRLLVFFDQRGARVIAPEQLSLGLFLQERAADGGTTYVRKLDGAHEIDRKGAARSARARDAARFERWIRASAAKRRPVEDYFLGSEASSKFAIATAGDGIPYRWFLFDGNTTVPWVAIAGGMAGATFNVFTAASNAVSAWTNDAGSHVLYSYQGTVASDDGNDIPGGDLNNAFIWNDPAGDIAGTYNCSSGILAIGGALFTQSTMLSNGVPYHRIVEGFVITQDGAACVFNGHGGLDGTEILTHEAGHTLGLNHSCESAACPPGSLLDEAVMRSFVHRDGRGAALNADDRAGIALLYPELAAPGARIFAAGFEN